MEKSSVSAVYENEIDFAKLGKLLWHKKWVVLIGTILAVVLTFFYTLLPKQSQFRATINYTSPITNDLAALNTQLNYHPLLKPLSIPEAFNLFQITAFSDLTKANFIQQYKLQPSVNQNYLPHSIQIELKKGNFFAVSLISANPNLAVHYVKNYVNFVHDSARGKLSAILKKQLKSFFLENQTNAGKPKNRDIPPSTEFPTLYQFKFNMNNTYLAHIEEQVELSPVLSRFTKQRLLILSLAIGFMLSCVIIIIFDLKSLLMITKD